MSRHTEYLRMIESFARLQMNIADLLENKATEAEKSSMWIRHHDFAEWRSAHKACIEDGLKIHEQLVEAIQGVTKMEAALGRHLKIVLAQDTGDSFGGFNPMLGAFGDDDS
jgi:hypothetical protein